MSSKPPIASNWPNSTRRSLPRTSMSFSMRAAKRSSPAVGRPARPLIRPDRPSSRPSARRFDAQQIANTVAALNGDPNITIDRHPSVRAAQAQLDQARLNLSYARVVAPDDGIVTQGRRTAGRGFRQFRSAGIFTDIEPGYLDRGEFPRNRL